MNAAETRINGASANVVIDSCTVGADLISAQFYYLYNIPTEEMPPKSLFITIKGSKSTMTKKAFIEVDMQDHKEIRTVFDSNLIDWDAIIRHPMLQHLNTGMNVKDDRVFIQPNGKMRYELNRLDRVTDTPVLRAAATFTEEYDSPNDLQISYDSSSHADKTETEDSSPSDSEGEPALPHISDNDTQGRQEEQVYQMLDGTPTLHP